MSETKIFGSALLVEDEKNIATALKIALRKLDIPAQHASTLKEARSLLEASKPELVLLDRALPDGDGITLCASLRKEGFKGMILMLTAAGDLADRVSGLNEGADDYLPKPFSWEEFEARVRALSRRFTPASKPGAGATSEKWEIDENRLRIQGPKGWTQLTPLEFRLAHRLIEAQGSIVGRDELLKDVWGFTLLPKTRTVDHFLGRLRKHFEDNPEDPRHFLTVRGAGYRFEI